jgi:hypothetical protein
MKLQSLGRGRRAVKGAIVTGAVFASLGALVLSQTPALADPSVEFVAAGSDTTQDVMNQFALDTGANVLASYNAFNPVSATAHELITPSKEQFSAAGVPNPNAAPLNANFTRPNGSGEGQAALRLSINPGSTAAVPGGATGVAPQQGAVDIARSSSGPGNNASTSGQLIFIPFALDAVTGSTGSTASTITVPGTTTTVNTPASNVQGANFTMTQLQTMYKSGTPQTATNGVTYDPKGTVAGDTPIDLYVPQAGSGTRNFWATQMGIDTNNLPAWVFDTIQSDGGNTVSQFVGRSVEEHDGTAVTVDPNGFAPFSIAQYISQKKGHNPRFHQAVLTQINGIAPTTGTGAGKLNPNFPITREVYNVVQFNRVVDTGTAGNPDTAFDPALASLLVGTGSALCQDQVTLGNFGFGTLPAPNQPDACGSTAATLRAFATV